MNIKNRKRPGKHSIFTAMFDLIFPRRENDALIADISPADFYKKIPRWRGEIYPDMQAIFHYKDPAAKAMIKELKSSRNKHAAKIAAHALANRLAENEIVNTIIIPMPISKERRKKRGYNQCELIADFLATELGARGLDADVEIRTDMLEKPIDTPKLALRNRAARLQANVGVFRARSILSSDQKRIIIIDDVITTGSTMRSAIGAVRAAGAKAVAGLGVAH